MPYTIREASELLEVSQMTIRRYIKAGKLNAQLIPGTFGQVWEISDIQAVNKKPSTVKSKRYTAIDSEVAQLHQEIGYWKARAMIAEERVKLLESPKQNALYSIWRKLFRH